LHWVGPVAVASVTIRILFFVPWRSKDRDGLMQDGAYNILTDL